MNESIDIDKIIRESVQTRRNLTAEKIAQATRKAEIQRSKAEQDARRNKQRNEQRSKIVQEIIKAAPAIATALKSEEVPFSFKEKKYVTAPVRREKIPKPLFGSKYTNTVERRLVDGDGLWAITSNKTTTYGSRDTATNTRDRIETASTQSFTITTVNGLCLTERGIIKRYTKYDTDLEHTLDTHEASDVHIVPLDPLSEAPIDMAAILSDWKEKFQQLFVE